MSKTIFKLDEAWLSLFASLNNDQHDGHDAVYMSAQDFADEMSSEHTSDEEYESHIHFFVALFMIWKSDPGCHRIKLKKVHKLAGSMMNLVTELEHNPDAARELELLNLTNRERMKHKD